MKTKHKNKESNFSSSLSELYFITDLKNLYNLHTDVLGRKVRLYQELTQTKL